MINPQVSFKAYIFRYEIHRLNSFLIIPSDIVVKLLITGKEKYLF